MRKIAKLISEWTGRAIQDKRIPAETNLGHLNAILTASALAYRLPLPTAPVLRAEEYYIIHCLGGVEEQLGRLNEYLVIDFDQTLTLTRKLWLQRYRMVHQPTSDEAMHLMLHATIEAEAELAPVYRECLCALTKEPVQQILGLVSEALDDQTTKEAVKGQPIEEATHG